MGDIQTQLPVKLTDGTNTVAINPTGPSLKVDPSSVTSPVSGTITNVPSGTQTTAPTGTQTTSDLADGPVSPGTAAGKSILGGMVYNTVAPAPTNGQQLALQSDANGNLKIAGSFTVTPSGTQTIAYGSGTFPVSGTITNVPSGTQTTTPTGTQAVSYGSGTFITSDLADGSVNPGAAGSKSILGGMVYNTAAPAPTNGQQLSLQSDSAGNLKVAGNLTVTPSGTQTVAYGSGTFPVSGTITNVPSGTQTVAGTGTFTVTPSGTQAQILTSNPTGTEAGVVTRNIPSGTQTTSDLADGPVSPGTAAGKSILAGLVYNTVAPAPTNGQQLSLQSDSAGNLKVTGSFTPSGTQTIAYGSGTFPVSGTITNVPSGTQTTTPTGTQAVSYGSGTFITSDLADGSVNPGAAGSKSMLGGMVYNTAAPAPTNGQQLSLQSDIAGNLKVTGSFTPSGTQTVAYGSGTFPVSGTITNVPSGTQTTTPTGTQAVSYGSGTFVTSDLADGSVNPGAAGSKSMLGGMVYNTAAPAPTNGQQLSLQSDNTGNLKVTIAGQSSGTQTVAYGSGTFPVSGTITNVPSGTQTVVGSGTFTTTPTGTQAVSYGSGTFVTSDLADGSVNPGAAGSKSILGGMVYNTAAPAPTNGQQLSLQSDSAGNLKVAGNLTVTPSGTQTVAYGSGTFPVSGTITNVPSGTQTTTPTGTQAVSYGSGTFVTSDLADGPVNPGAAASKSILGGMVYNTAAPAPTNGQQLSLQSDIAGNLKVTGSFTPSGTQTVAYGSGTFPVSGTITNVPSGTQTTTPTGTQTTSDLADGPVTPGAAAGKSILGGMVYNTAAPAPTNTQQLALQSDITGNLKVNIAAGTVAVSGTVPVSGTVTNVPSGTQTVVGSGTFTTTPTGTQAVSYGSGTFVTSDLADGSVNPGAAGSKSMLGGMVYNTAAPAPTNGQQLSLQSDNTGNLKVTIAGQSSGTQTVAYGSGTFPVSGTITNVPSGTQTTAPTGTQTVADLADGPVTPGTAAGKSMLGGMVYNTVAPAPTNTQQLALQSDNAGNLKVNIGAGTVAVSGTVPVSGTVTNVPSGTQTVVGSGTFTTTPTGTQAVSYGSGTFVTSDLADGSVNPGAAGSKSMLGGMVYNTAAPAPTNGQQLSLQSDIAGNLKVAGTLTTVPSGTQTVTGTVVAVPITTSVVCSYTDVATVAAASTGTISYTTTAAQTFYWNGIMASSSGGPCRVQVDYGAGPTIVCVAFYSASAPFLNIVFPQPLSIAANTTINVKIMNNAGLSQDVYATIWGSEH